MMTHIGHDHGLHHSMPALLLAVAALGAALLLLRIVGRNGVRK